VYLRAPYAFNDNSINYKNIKCLHPFSVKLSLSLSLSLYIYIYIYFFFFLFVSKEKFYGKHNVPLSTQPVYNRKHLTTVTFSVKLLENIHYLVGVI
jgi:hypothetical protein